MSTASGLGRGPAQASTMRVALVATAMRCGGAERVMAGLAAHLAGRGHGVTLHVLNEPDVFYQLDAGVEVRTFASGPLASGARATRPWRRVRWLRRRLAALAPDGVVSFIEVANVITLLAARGLGLPVLVAERSNPRLHPVPWPYGWLRPWLYRGAARVVVQTEATAAWARGLVAYERVVVLPNPVWPPGDATPELVLGPGRWLACMGRLVPLKRFDMVIDVFASLAPRHPGWSLLVLGEGEQRAALERAVARHGLGGRVLLPGSVHAPGALLRRCDLFVLASEYEGFPNALCEAMACGLPAVTFDCPTGPSEIVRDGVDGLLLPNGDRAALEVALDRLMADDGERRRLASRAPEIVRRFSASEILARWEALLTESSAAARGRGRA
ncbi:MAG: glycosyltransferase family 4 protein [Thermoanaerobaculaceae bacterium]